MKKCQTCRYGSEYELDKPCVVYRADCPLYQKVGDEMTNKEAIRLLESERDNHINGNGVIYETRTEALDMAIKALEQEPSGDLISRQAVLEQINCWIGSGEYRYTNATDYLNKRIKALQAVNSQEKVGYWIENAPEYQNIDPPYICSECGNMHLGKTNYCDQCGCRMVEPQESEDNNG